MTHTADHLPAALAARIEHLETDAAHRARALDDLDGAVRAQWAVIDALVRRVGVLEERLAEAEARASAAAPSVPPPHF